MVRRSIAVTLLVFTATGHAGAASELNAPAARKQMARRAKNYTERNTANPVRMNLFRANNAGETYQNRHGLTVKGRGDWDIHDVDLGKLINWKKTGADHMVSDAASMLAIRRGLPKDLTAPVALFLTSNTHVLNDVLSTGTFDQLKARGIPVAALEYPGYGGSLGVPSRQNWVKAASEAARIVGELTGKKPILIGHSIGGAVALEAAAKAPSDVGGVITIGGFYSLLEMAKDQKKWPLPRFASNLINQALTLVLAPTQLFSARKPLATLAANGVPVTAIHNAGDHSVPVRHLSLLQRRMDAVTRTSPRAQMKTIELAGGHEELHDLGTNPSEALWDTVVREMKTASKR